jgi:hypothetical protein
MKKKVPDLTAVLKSLTPSSLALSQSVIDEMIALVERQKILTKRLAIVLTRLQRQIDAAQAVLDGVKRGK